MSYTIGINYDGKNQEYYDAVRPYIGHIECSPDALTVIQSGQETLYTPLVQELRSRSVQDGISILVHGTGLSIGSATGWNHIYIQKLRQLIREIPDILWHSEHLGYTQVNGTELGTMLTLPRTRESLELICDRVHRIQDEIRKPFLLENVISMLPDYQIEYSDAAFLNEIHLRTGCHFILDIYNMECDAYNFGLDIPGFLGELNPDIVQEIHLAGGAIHPEFDFQMDIHSRGIQASTYVWLKTFLQKRPKELKAITYEILEEFVPVMGVNAIINEIQQLDHFCKTLHHEVTKTARTNPESNPVA